MTFPSTKKPRVLLLDWSKNYLLELLQKNVDLVTFGESDTDWYERFPASQFRGQIAAVVRQEEYELIILGNNMGAGIKLAELIPEEARAKIVVASHLGLEESEEYQYRTLGVSRFSFRKDVYDLVSDLAVHQ